MLMEEREGEYVTVNVKKNVHQALRILQTHANYDSLNDLIAALLENQNIDNDPDVSRMIKKFLEKGDKEVLA